MQDYEYKDEGGRFLCRLHHRIRCDECHYVSDLRDENKRYREAMKKIWKLTETDAGTEEQVFIIADDILKQDKEEVKRPDDRTVESPHSSWF